ncbi:hypothetical protein HPB50_000076 [Hyalomma asiaticum]|uniref:Uncharacterized protein n=1 Tax=Hyalomma asiaticum TaxID=266040 RepID=A0ACB7T2W3_HYAAI|nr:hypothetical protein HPB50_000076 [Hyalomma asiaticum]
MIRGLSEGLEEAKILTDDQFPRHETSAARALNEGGQRVDMDANRPVYNQFCFLCYHIAGPGPSGQGPPSSGGAPPAVQPPPVIQPPVAPPPAIPPPVGPSPPVAPPPVAPPPVTPPPVAPPPVAPPPVAPPPVAPPKVTPPPTPKPKVTQPPVPPPTRRPPPPKPPTPTTKPTTTPRPFSVDELVCTVGRTAFYAEVYPPDGLCHHIYYRDVAVVHGALIGVEIMSSWEMFKMVMMKYTKTSGGMAFDVRYASPTSLNATVEKELDMLASKNVKNYAVLNVLEVPDKLSKLYNDAKPLLMKLKNLQGSDKKRKTLIGIGILNYKLSNAMSRLRDIFNDAVNQHVADTVIAYSSVGWIESRKECYSHPPSVFDRRTFDQSAAVEAARMPEIRSIATLMTRDKTFSSDTKMGLSFELGTLAYNLRQPGGTFDSVNAHCSLMYVTKYDVLPCKLDVFANRNELFQGVNVADVPKDTKKVFLFEDDATITKKCNNLAQNSTYLRHGMSLLLNNVDLGDFTKNGSCADDADRQDPMVRLVACLDAGSEGTLIAKTSRSLVTAYFRLFKEAAIGAELRFNTEPFLIEYFASVAASMEDSTDDDLFYTVPLAMRIPTEKAEPDVAAPTARRRRRSSPGRYAAKPRGRGRKAASSGAKGGSGKRGRGRKARASAATSDFVPASAGVSRKAGHGVQHKATGHTRSETAEEKALQAVTMDSEADIDRQAEEYVSNILPDQAMVVYPDHTSGHAPNMASPTYGDSYECPEEMDVMSPKRRSGRPSRAAPVRRRRRMPVEGDERVVCKVLSGKWSSRLPLGTVVRRPSTKLVQLVAQAINESPHQMLRVTHVYAALQ